MEGLMNVGSLVLGLIAWILPVVNLAQHNKISSKRYAAFTVTSFSFCAATLSLQLFYTDHLVKTEDWSALLDTSHATALVATLLLVVTIVLNISALLVYFRKNRTKF
jgi:cytochrome c oxidase subunit 4